MKQSVQVEQHEFRTYVAWRENCRSMIITVADCMNIYDENDKVIAHMAWGLGENGPEEEFFITEDEHQKWVLETGGRPCSP